MTTGNTQYFSVFARRSIPTFLILTAILAPQTVGLMFAQDPTTESEVPPGIQAMVKTLLTESADPALRQLQAEALLQDDNTVQAQQALIDILQSDNDVSAQIIICQAIAARPNPLLAAGHPTSLSADFIDPLFKALLGDNPKLSSVAAQALSKCRNGLTEKLSHMALNTKQSQSHRLAAISALTLLPGKEPILILADLLDETQPAAIRHRAAQALADMLLPNPTHNLGEFVRTFHRQYLPKIKKTDDTTFLLWQMERIQQELDLTKHDRDALKQQGQQWFDKYVEQLTGQFQAKAQSEERLVFIRAFLVDQPEPLLRVWALKRIHQWSTSESVQSDSIAQPVVKLIVPFISDPNPQVRQLTAETLSLLEEHAKATAPTLMEQLGKEKDALAQAALIQALGTFEYLPAVTPALRLLNDSDSPAVVGQAARALGKIAASQTPLSETKPVEEISLSLAKRYNDFNDTAEVRLDFIRAIRNIAAQEQHLRLAKDTFNVILKEALNDSFDRIRSEAVYALAQIHREAVLDLLLQPKNLLDDPDTAVRLAVIGVIQSYPDKKSLLPLQQRLPLEDKVEVANLIVSAFGTILTTQPMSDVYDWVVQLIKSTGNGSATKQGMLCDQAVGVLSEKLNQAKASEREYPMEYELLVLRHQAETAQRDHQPAIAVSRYLALIKLRPADVTQSNAWRQHVVRIALQTPQDETLLPQAQKLDWNLLLAGAGAAGLLAEIDQRCQEALSNPDTAVEAARILVHLILPLKDRLPADSIGLWDTRRIQAALALMDRLDTLLADESAQEDPKILDLLGLLDSRLSDYPRTESVENRRAALAEFRKLLQPIAQDTYPVPDSSPGIEPNTVTPTAD